MKLLKIIYILLILAGLLTASGGNRTGTAGAQELLIPIGAKGISLAGSQISNMVGIDALYFNPAGISGSDYQTEVAFSSMNHIADIDMLFGAISVDIGSYGTLGFSIRSLDFGAIDETTVAEPEGTGATFSPTFVVMGITYANFLSDRIKAGVTFNLVSETIQNTSATGLALDVGLQYSQLANIEGLSMGVVLRNFGPQMSFSGEDLYRRATESNSNRSEQVYSINAEEFELPSQLEIGMAYTQAMTEQFNAVLSGSFLNNNFSNDEIKVGAEVGYDNMLFLRGGYSLDQGSASAEDYEYIFGPSFGLGVKIEGDVDIIFDYAFRQVNVFDPNQIFSLKLAF